MTASGTMRRSLPRRLASLLEDPTVSVLLRSRLFWAVLAFKLVLGATLASFYLRELFVPFVNYFVESGFSNPWHQFAAEGRLRSFPYPPVMLYIMALPRWVLGAWLPAGTESVSVGHLIAMRLPLLAADVAIAAVLLRWFPQRRERVLWFYWGSPFVIYVGYWHGQLDLVPTALFVLGLALLKAERPASALVVLGLALATKSHLFVAVPFVLMYVWQEYGWARTARWTGLMLIASLLAVGPYLPDPAFRRMVYGTDEQERLFAFRLSLDTSGLAILLAPAAITILWLRFAAYTKRNWDLLMLYLGVLFCVFVLLAPPRPGYFVWSLPFLIHFMCRTRAANGLLYFAYGGAYLLFFWLGRESDLFDAWRLVWPDAVTATTPHTWLAAHGVPAATIENLLFSAMEGTLACLIVSMYFVGVRSNEVYGQRTTPVLIGIAGDSASGKRSFAGLVARVLGEPKVTLISGDDYHRWPRGHEMYRVYTHLNASANALHRQQEHAFALSRGKSIMKGIYDHRTGAFTEERLLDPSEYVVFTGLHALAIGQQRSVYDLRVFLDPDEALRRMWKVRRDCAERGYEATAVLEMMQRREKDREAYILPQREHADLVVSWSPADGVDVAGPGPTTLVLNLKALNGFDLQPTVDALRQSRSLTVDHEPFSDARWQALRLVGTITVAELRATADEVVPNLTEITPSPHVVEGLPGCLQLFFLVCLSWKLRWRGEAPELPHEPDGRN